MITKSSIAENAGELELSWEMLDKLAGKHGDSFYILDLPTFDHNYQEFLNAFRGIYPNSQIAYSYKTNYIPRLCQYVNSAGGYAEVVSEMEYQLALRVGVSPRRIIFNGPSKGDDQIGKALLAGSIVNLDGFGDLQSVEAIAAGFPHAALRIGVRCNFPVSGERASRFGFDVESGDLEAVFRRLRKLPNCDLVGLHCHFSTKNRSPESFALRTSRLLGLCRHYFGPRGPEVIDIGGGFFSPMSESLQKLFGVDAPGYKEYAAAIASQLATAYSGENGPELILEPGSALVANAMLFVARIVEIKTIGSRLMAVAAGSIHNIKPTLHSKNMPVRIFSPCGMSGRAPAAKPFDIVGYTCMEHDCLHQGYEQMVAKGDYAVFDNVGAYTIVMKPPFIRSSPPIVAVRTGRSGFELVKHRETLSELFSAYVF